MGLAGGSISLEYLPDGPLLPNSAACFNIIRLPNNPTQESFNSKMDIGILYSNGYYGLA